MWWCRQNLHKPFLRWHLVMRDNILPLPGVPLLFSFSLLPQELFWPVWWHLPELQLDRGGAPLYQCSSWEEEGGGICGDWRVWTGLLRRGRIQLVQGTTMWTVLLLVTYQLSWRLFCGQGVCTKCHCRFGTSVWSRLWSLPETPPTGSYFNKH